MRLDTFKGVFSNGDPEDIPKEMLTRLRNLRAVNGRLEKTFGYGLHASVTGALTETMRALWTFINPNLTGGKLYLAYGVTSSGYVRLYGWDVGATPDAWVLIGSVTGFTQNDAYYARIARNPIFQYDEVLRFLPGNAAAISHAFAILSVTLTGGPDQFAISGDQTAYFSVGQIFTVAGSTSNNGTYVVASVTTGGGNTLITVASIASDAGDMGTLTISDTAQGLWIGYISRARWDGIVAASAGFYIYPTNLAVFALTVTTTMIDFGATIWEIINEVQYRYYKFAYVYDGVQESLLSTVQAVDIGADGDYYPKFEITVPQSLNPRITGLRVYRSEDHDGEFKRIHTINFLRASGNVSSGSGAGGYAPVAAGAYDGQRTVYIPALSAYDFPNEVGYRYRFADADGNYYTLDYSDTITGDGNTVFSLSGADELAVDWWNVSWKLYVSTDGGTNYAAVSPEQSGSSGFFSGPHVAIVNSALTGINDYAGGMFYFNDTILRRIDANHMRAFKFVGDVLGTDFQARNWKLLSPSKGLYTFTADGSDVDIVFYDNGFGSEFESPYASDEKSNLIHGKFARLINGMLWQANLILAPGTSDQETHVDWVSYSLPGCPDANPVSRVRKMPDKHGSAVTGVYELLGMPVITHERAVIMVNTKGDPNNPAIWYDMEASHAIGCVAEQGGIEAKGKLYVCSIDGIYGLAPNSFAESDRTPLEQLRVSEPINDVYLALTFAQKQAIKAEYDATKSEIVFVFAAGGAWRYNVDRDEWREETTARTIAAMTQDEEGNVLAYSTEAGGGANKIYTSAVAESVIPLMRTKVFSIESERDYVRVVRELYVMFKSTEAVTVRFLDAENTPSGSLKFGATYYVESYTSVTYNVTAYTAGQTFTATLGSYAYTPSGTGKVLHTTSVTLTAQTVEKLADAAPNFRAKKFFIELSAATSTNAVKIDSIRMEHD
jgi:hypothetical protein